MISRRELLASGVAAGALASPEEATAAQESDTVYLNRILEELRGIRKAVSFQGAQAVAQVRLAQRTFLKNSSRFPEFVDVGFDVYESVIDWLIAVQQPVTINRIADGRYSVALFATTIVLRPDFPDNYVGQGYDK
jgi:hypothetical protein